MEEITKTLIQLIVFYFFAAQFMYAFGASNLGALIAVSGAELLKSLALPPQVTVLGIIIFIADMENTTKTFFYLRPPVNEWVAFSDIRILRDFVPSWNIARYIKIILKALPASVNTSKHNPARLVLA